MSRIFDALRRSESERSGADNVTLPQGPDLLRRAERRVTSSWVTVSNVTEQDIAAVDESVDRGAAERETSPSIRAQSGDGSAEVSAKDHPFDAVSQFPSLQISLSSQSRLVCLTDRETPTAEAVRLLGVRLRDLRRIKPLKKILITSTIPQEGKSTVAANLACALAYASDERVLLVEGDLRRPSLSRMFGIEASSGLFEWLSDTDSPVSGIYRLQDADLWLLPAGKSSKNPLQLLQSEKLPAVLNQLAAWFDWIIIDSPPVLPLADTSVWTRLADGVLLVTRQGTTEKHQLKKGLDALDRKKTLGAVVNGAITPAYSSYYYSPSISS